MALPLEIRQRECDVPPVRTREHEGFRGREAAQPPQVRQGDLNSACNGSLLSLRPVYFDQKKLAIQRSRVALAHTRLDEFQRLAIGSNQAVECSQPRLFRDGIQISQLDFGRQPQGPFREFGLGQSHAFFRDLEPFVALARRSRSAASKRLSIPPFRASRAGSRWLRQTRGSTRDARLPA